MKSCKSNSKKCDEYPRLMEGVTSGVIVLMESRHCGTVVHGTSSYGNKVGEYCTDWGVMKPYNGSITLDNDQ